MTGYRAYTTPGARVASKTLPYQSFRLGQLPQGHQGFSARIPVLKPSSNTVSLVAWNTAASDPSHTMTAFSKKLIQSYKVNKTHFLISKFSMATIGLCLPGFTLFSISKDGN